MRLRQLQLKDAPLMLEWMHDPDVVKFMHADFASKTLTDCERFIQAAKSSAETLHYAVVNDEDVSFDYVLKDGDRVNIITNDISFGPRLYWEEKAVTTLAKRRIRELNYSGVI